MKNFLPKFALKKLSTYVAVIVIFVHNVVLDKDLECSCKRQALDCNYYMIMPFFIIFVLQLWTDRTFLRAWKYTCACTCMCTDDCKKDFKTRCKLFSILVYHIVKAVLVGLLWVTSVFIDGDWYVCCQNDHSEQQAQLACKNKDNLTAEEKAIIAELKNHSMVIGMSLLFCTLFLAALISSFGRMTCCKDSSCCNRNILYYKVILDEEENVLKEILTKAAKEKLTDAVKLKMGEPKWQKCFDVAKELIEQPTAPTFPEAAGNQEHIPLEQRRSEDRRPEEPEDRRPEARRPEDRRPEARRPEDRRPEDRRPEARRPEVNPFNHHQTVVCVTLIRSVFHIDCPDLYILLYNYFSKLK
ncbi:uncharacterized protein LOC116059179 isoform X2 [Sander lucioperca]|uniref:uncharacterized protein LOC116059179 isoform X2 n=1 Tax=Sander lucioperca TaxID=283035 RepID=UPI00125E6012|nr:uncharacterized protein LOC116059179 isoform X2 [Sander lucioperca]